MAEVILVVPNLCQYCQVRVLVDASGDWSSQGHEEMCAFIRWRLNERLVPAPILFDREILNVKLPREVCSLPSWRAEARLRFDFQSLDRLSKTRDRC
jgi:hypothetical protein